MGGVVSDWGMGEGSISESSCYLLGMVGLDYQNGGRSS